MNNDLEQCPYNKSHKIFPHRFGKHLMKCRLIYLYERKKSGLPIHIDVCMYNYEHHVEDMKKHLAEDCIEYKELQIFQSEFKMNETIKNLKNLDVQGAAAGDGENGCASPIKNKPQFKEEQWELRDETKFITNNDTLTEESTWKELSRAELLALFRKTKHKFCKAERRELESKLDEMGAFEKIPSPYRPTRNWTMHKDRRIPIGFPGWTLQDGCITSKKFIKNMKPAE